LTEIPELHIDVKSGLDGIRDGNLMSATPGVSIPDAVETTVRRNVIAIESDRR